MGGEEIGGGQRRIDRVTCEQFSRGYMQDSRPAILTDALEDWHVDERWSPNYLASIAGRRRVTVSFAKEGFFYNKSEASDWTKGCDYQVVEMTFEEAIRIIDSSAPGKQIYILAQSLNYTLPELLENLSTPIWNTSPTPEFSLWLGRDTRGALHHDFADNFFAQVHGTKKFIIFRPEESRFMYQYPPEARFLHFSSVNANKPDMMSYPEFSRASPIEFELRAGEMLYLPGYWWHQVDGIGISASVSNWTTERFVQLLEAPNSDRGLLWEYRKDRLARLEEECLRAEDLDFISSAHRLLTRGRNCGAYILALAAFDRKVASLHPRRRPVGCSLKELAEELKVACPIICGTSQLSRGICATIESIPALTMVASRCDDSQLQPWNTVRLIEAVESLCQNDAKGSKQCSQYKRFN